MPDAKLLFLFRNPVERTWSGFRRQGLTDDQIRARLARPRIDRRTDYLTAIDTWTSAYPREQLFMGFYDDIAADPLADVFGFLGVDTRHLPPGLGRRVNAAPPAEMPADLPVVLTRRHLSLLRGLSTRFGGHATAWLAAAEHTLAAVG